MRWIVPVVIIGGVALGACGGTQVPTHAGYKNEKVKPWKKPKGLPFDDKLEAKADGELSYPEMRRARWYSLDIPSNGELSIRLEITPPGDATNDEFDLAIEVLDPGFRVISKSDLEDEDAFEVTKTKTLYDLAPGKYLVHLYLQGRLDSAEYELRATFKPTAPAEVKSNFPMEVEFVPVLAMVPLQDDAPTGYKPDKAKVVIKGPRGPRPPRTPTTVTPPPGTIIKARIIGIAVGSSGTVITVGRGTTSEPAAVNGMMAKVAGVSGAFAIHDCGDRTCKATVKATLDQITKAGGTVVLSP